MKTWIPLSDATRLLFGFLQLRRRRAASVFLLDVAASVCMLSISLALSQALAALFGFRSLRGSLMGLFPNNASAWVAWLAGIIAAKFFIDWQRQVLRGRLMEDFSAFLRERAFDWLLHAGQGDAGKSLLRFGGDLGSAQRLLSRGVLQFAADGVLLLSGLLLIACLDLRLALLTTLSVALAAGVLHRINLRMRRMEKKQRGKKADLLAFVSRSLEQLPGIQALNRATRTGQQFRRKSDAVRMSGYATQRWAGLSEATSLFFTQIQLLLVLAAGLYGGARPEALFAVVMIQMAWRSAVSRMLRAGLVWKKGLLSLEKIAALERRAAVPQGRVVLPGKKAQTLQVKTLALPSGELSFSLQTGQQLCIALPVGSGKTALTRMLAGLQRPETGRIELDGHAVDHIEAHCLRRQMAFVSDAFTLTGRTWLDAISKSSQPAALQEAASFVRACQLVVPGLDTIHWQQNPDTRKLSSGQQRILQCLRALLADKPFLLLDEPFAGLDAATVQALAALLQQHASGKGVLLLTTQPEGLPEAWTLLDFLKKNTTTPVTNNRPSDMLAY